MLEQRSAMDLRVDVVVLELLVQGRAIDLEDRGGLRLVAAGGGERGEDALLLELAQRARRGGAGGGSGSMVTAGSAGAGAGGGGGGVAIAAAMFEPSGGVGCDCRVRAGAAWASTWGGRSAAMMGSGSPSTTARSTALRSSRTLPGHA